MGVLGTEIKDSFSNWSGYTDSDRICNRGICI